MNRRKLLKTAATGLFVAAAPAIIRPSDAQILQFSGRPTPSTPSGIPLAWNAPQFSGNTPSSPVTLTSGQTLSNRSFTGSAAPGQSSSIIMNNNTSIINCNVDSDECVRIKDGNYTIQDCYLEATGIPGDHADTIQCYNGGPARFIINITRSCVVAHNDDATAGLFAADDCTGDMFITDVVFWGGPFGMKINADVGGDTRLWLNRVYFVGPFGTAPYTFLDYMGGQVLVQQWDDVYNATIVGGVLIPGSPLAPP